MTLKIEGLDLRDYCLVPAEGRTRGEKAASISSARHPGVVLTEADHGVVITRGGQSTLIPWQVIRQVYYASASAPESGSSTPTTTPAKGKAA